jgi:hypothetical protein
MVCDGMLKAEVLKLLKTLDKAELATIYRELPWVGIHPESVRRILLGFEAQKLVARTMGIYGPVYSLTRLGLEMCALIAHVETFYSTKIEELYKSGFTPDIVNLALRTNIIEQKHGLISRVTTGCADLATGAIVSGVFCPNNHFITVEGWPLMLTCPVCGVKLQYVEGKYVAIQNIKNPIISAVEGWLQTRPRLLDWLANRPRLLGPKGLTEQYSSTMNAHQH